MESKRVFQYELDGRLRDSFDSSEDASRKTGCNGSHIRACIRGDRKSHGGFTWRHADNDVNIKTELKSLKEIFPMISFRNKFGRDPNPNELDNFIKYGTQYHPDEVAFKKHVNGQMYTNFVRSKLGLKDDMVDDTRSPLQEVCDTTQINEEDINHFWYKGKHFSLHVKNQLLNAEAQFKALLDESKKNIKPIRPLHETGSPNHCAVINIYDAHLDKRDIRYKELGGKQVDCLTLEIEHGFAKLLKSTLVNDPDTFIFPVGNDLFTTNGFVQTTKRGTPQDPTVPHAYVFQEGLALVRRMIDTLTQYGEVYVPIIRGNHSQDAEHYLGVCLSVIYENNSNVTIENSDRDRKYFQYASNLFGFTHGDKLKNNIDKLPLMMATENTKTWGDTKYRVYFCGDQHHKQEFKFFRVKDFAGCEVKYLRSVGITDAWHDENGFIGIPRTMESYIFNKDKGQVANYSVNI